MIDHGRVGSYEEPDSFVGRERELDDLRQFALGMRAVTLCGAGGIGKTRLMLRLVADLAPEFPDGTYVVGLADLRQPELVVSRVASVIGVSEEPGVPLPDTLADTLRGRRMLLALDNCEHLIDACASLCQRLLAGAPGLLVVATSREALRVAAEAVWPVPPLDLPPAGVTDPGTAAGYDAVRLFAERAAAASPGFALNAGNGAAVTGICRALDGLPLAIELAAAWVRALTVDQIAARLSDRFRLLTSGDRTVPERHRTLRATIDWSYDLLTRPEQVLLRRLSVFAGWSLEMAERVCADDGLPAVQILGLLSALAEKSLVELEPDVLGQSRYRMLDTIREYAADRLARAGETLALRRRLRDYALTVSEYFLSIGVARVPALWSARVNVFLRYEADVDNVRAALGWCLEQDDIEAGLRLCTSIRPCWIVVGAFAEGAEWYDALLAAGTSEVSAAVLGPALVGRAQLALGSDDRRQAEPMAAEGLKLCRAAGDPHFTATALNLLAEIALHAARPQEALQRATEAVEQARQAADKWNEGYALGSCATALAAQGRLAEARDSAEAALALMIEIDQQWGAARTMLGLASLERLLGNLDGARGYYLRALDLLRPVKGDPEISRCLAGLGRVALDRGDLAEARQYLSQGLEMSLAIGSRTGISRGLLAFATLAVREGRPDRAVQLAAAVTALSAGSALPARSDRESERPLREAAHLPPLPPERVQRYLDAAAGLGQGEVDRLWAAGLKLTPAAAAELALERPAAGSRHEQSAPPAAGLADTGLAGTRPHGTEPHGTRLAGTGLAGTGLAGTGLAGTGLAGTGLGARPDELSARSQPQAQQAQGPAAPVLTRPPGPAALAGGAPAGGGAGLPGGTLTAREREVVELITLGLSNKAIAEELFISPATAARHVANILAKLGYTSRSQVAAWAAAAGAS
jgi:predicted ATPase/DNA-binding CsgD family transcriptional regulator